MTQEMLLEASPCSIHNHDSRGFACAAATGCGWCGRAIGCTDRSSCRASTEATRALVDRQLGPPPDRATGWSSLTRVAPPTFTGVLPNYRTLISVVVLTCNRLPYLLLTLEQIDAHRKQLPYDTPPPLQLEVIVVDDSPANSTAHGQAVAQIAARFKRMEILQEADLPPAIEHVTPHTGDGYGVEQPLAIRFVRLSQRASVGYKRTASVRAARGEVLVHWDDDDMQPPGLSLIHI